MPDQIVFAIVGLAVGIFACGAVFGALLHWWLATE